MTVAVKVTRTAAVAICADPPTIVIIAIWLPNDPATIAVIIAARVGCIYARRMPATLLIIIAICAAAIATGLPA